MRFSALLFGAVFLATGIGGLAGGWQRNQAAVETLGVCLKNAPASSDTEVFEKEDLAWFAAVQGKCAGNADLEKGFLMQALADSGARLTVIRAFMPEEIDLASYAIEMHPKNSSALFWLGDLHEERGEPEAAILAYKWGLENEPGDGLYWRKLGNLYEALGDIEAAVNAYDRACFLVDRGKNGCPNAGRIYMSQGRYDLAAHRYRESIKQLPSWLAAKKGLAKALLAMGQTEDAVPYLQILAKNGDLESNNLLMRLDNEKD